MRNKNRIKDHLLSDTLRSLSSILLISSILVFLIIAATALYGLSNRGVSPPELMGNGPENIGYIESLGEEIRPFSFFVAGDHHIGNYLRLLYPDEVKSTDHDFGIIVGDILRKPNRERNDYFLMQFDRWGVDRPIFVVVGNHDVLEGEAKWARIKYSGLPNGFGLDDFRDVYGADNFYFKYAGCLFIGLDDIDSSAEDGRISEHFVEFLEDVLKKEARDALMIFVFMHIPPQNRSPLEGICEYPKIDSQKFSSLIEKYEVDYVFSGHFHSYLRGNVGETNYVISGGGLNINGGKLKEQDQFHVMMIYVDPVSGTVHERIYTACDRKIDRMWDWIKVTTYTELWPPLKYFGGLEDLSDEWEVPVIKILLLDILLFIAAGFSLLLLRRKRSVK
jgi:3',5'-cyclic AMP phosphodiesterase CpdA